MAIVYILLFLHTTSYVSIVLWSKTLVNTDLWHSSKGVNDIAQVGQSISSLSNIRISDNYCIARPTENNGCSRLSVHLSHVLKARRQNI